MSKESLVLAQILKQAGKGKWYSHQELEQIFKIYDVKWEDMQILVKKLKTRNLV